MTVEFERAVLPHLDAAYNLARWLVHDARDAEDVVQEAFLRAVTHFAGFRGGDGKAWVLSIVRNCAFDWLRRRRTGVLVPLDQVLEPAGSIRGALDTEEAPRPEGGLQRAAERERLQQAVAALAPEFREVLVLREVEDLSYRDIATAIGAPVGTVMSRLARARAQLKRSWRRVAKREMRHGM